MESKYFMSFVIFIFFLEEFLIWNPNKPGPNTILEILVQVVTLQAKGKTFWIQYLNPGVAFVLFWASIRGVVNFLKSTLHRYTALSLKAIFREHPAILMFVGLTAFCYIFYNGLAIAEKFKNANTLLVLYQYQPLWTIILLGITIIILFTSDDYI